MSAFTFWKRAHGTVEGWPYLMHLRNVFGQSFVRPLQRDWMHQLYFHGHNSQHIYLNSGSSSPSTAPTQCEIICFKVKVFVALRFFLLNVHKALARTFHRKQRFTLVLHPRKHAIANAQNVNNECWIGRESEEKKKAKLASQSVTHTICTWVI